MHLTSLCRIVSKQSSPKGAANCNARVTKFERERHLLSLTGKTLIYRPGRSLEVTRVAVDPSNIWSADNVKEETIIISFSTLFRHLNCQVASAPYLILVNQHQRTIP